MIDPIDRQAAIDALGEEPEVWSGKDEYERGLNNQWHYDVTALKAVPSAQTDEMKGLIRAIRAGIVATSTNDVYSCGMRNGMRWCLGLVDDKEPTYESVKSYMKVVRSMGGTMWYECDKCGEPVDEKDKFCRGCGRRFENGGTD